MLKTIKEILPSRIYSAVYEITKDYFLEEIRIRRGRQAYIVASGQNILIPIIANEDEIQHILMTISHNSLYAHRDTINKGYVSLDNGIRIGIIGRASVDRGEVSGVYSINEFVIRIPNKIKIKCKSIVELIKKEGAAMLIYSPPGVGKTTLLRNIAKELSSGADAKRVALIDTRHELSFDLDERDLLISDLMGYPRKLGIEIAVRTMNAQILICDEIGDVSDASAIIEAQGAGVPLIATCHGNSIRSIFSHSGILMLHKAHIFDYYIGIERGNELNFHYTVSRWEEADADL